MKHKVLNVEGIFKCFILILRQYNKQTWDFFDGLLSYKNSSSRTSAAVAQLLSSPRGSPCGRSHHIQLCSGLRLKPVSSCLLWGRPSAALVVKSCLKQLVVLQDEPIFFPFHSHQHLPPPDFFCCLIFQTIPAKHRLHFCVANPSSAASCSWLTTFPVFGGLQIWEGEAPPWSGCGKISDFWISISPVHEHQVCLPQGLRLAHTFVALHHLD